MISPVYFATSLLDIRSFDLIPNHNNPTAVQCIRNCWLSYLALCYSLALLRKGSSCFSKIVQHRTAGWLWDVQTETIIVQFQLSIKPSSVGLVQQRINDLFRLDDANSAPHETHASCQITSRIRQRGTSLYLELASFSRNSQNAHDSGLGLNTFHCQHFSS